MRKNNHFLANFCVVLLSQVVFAQSPDQNNFKHFTDTDGKVYWNRNVPVYIRLSASPDDKGELLRSEVHEKYVDPYYFDTEGKNFVRTKWAIDPRTGEHYDPLLEVLWEVYADGLAPNIYTMYTGKSWKKAGKTYYGITEIELKASDKVSGTENIFYKMNGSDQYIPYQNPIKIAKSGENEIQFYAVDRVGNVSEVKTERFILDKQPPVSSHEIAGGPSQTYLDKKGKIKFSSDDGEGIGVSHIHYKIDEGKENAYEIDSWVYLGWLKEGKHTISYAATDKVGNQEAWKTIVITIDKTPPTLRAKIDGKYHKQDDIMYYEDQAKVRVLATDSSSGVSEIYYSYNGSEYQIYSTPIPLTIEKGLKVKLFYYALDKAGNKSNITSDYKLGLNNAVLDTIDPKISYSYEGPKVVIRDTIYISKRTKIRIDAADYESGVKKVMYGMHGNSFEYRKLEFMQIEEEGFHSIQYTARDNVNNQKTETLPYYVDETPPHIHHHFSMDPIGEKTVREETYKVYDTRSKLYLAATDRHVGTHKIYYKINDLPEKEYTKPIEGFKAGQKEVKVRAVDRLGNESTYSITFDLDH